MSSPRPVRRQPVLCALLSAAVALVVWVAPSSAEANDDAYRELKRINNSINSVRRSFPDRVGDRLSYEGKVIANLRKRLATQRSKMTPNLKIQKAAYKSVMDNLVDAEAYVVVLEKVHAVATQISEVQTAHRRKRPVTDAKLAKLDKAIAALAATKNKSWSKATANWSKKAKDLRAANPKVAVAADKAAADKASAGRRKGAKSALWKLNNAMSRNQPITPEMLKALEDAIAPMAGKDEAMATYFQAELARFKAQAAWDIHGERAAGEIANVLGGKLVLTGMSKGKKLKVKFSAEANKCYAVYMRYKRWSGAEKVKDVELRGKGKRPLQEFSVQQDNSWKTPRVRGFCTVAPSKVSVTGALEFAGTKNGVRYAFIEWTRDTFPLALAGRMYLNYGDLCDTQHWFDLWDKPIPGTLIYVGTQPVLVTEPGYLTGRNGYVGSNGVSVGQGRFHLGKARSGTATPPRAIAITSKNAFKKCGYGHKNPKASPMSRKISKCHAAIDKKYDSQWRSINRLRDAARRQNAISPSAERRADRLGSKQRRDRARRCGPLEKKAEKAAAKVYDRLADALADKQFKPRIDRAEYIRQILK